MNLELEDIAFKELCDAVGRLPEDRLSELYEQVHIKLRDKVPTWNAVHATWQVYSPYELNKFTNKEWTGKAVLMIETIPEGRTLYYYRNIDEFPKSPRDGTKSVV